MTVIKKNLAANFVGKLWMALISIIFLPFYIKLIGKEAYGIVGLHTTLLTLFSLLDLGLGTTMNREMARMIPQQSSPEEFRNLTRTLEWIYWPCAALVVVVVFALSPLIAKHWVNPIALTEETIRQALYCIGIAIALQLPSTLYSSGLMGLQRQSLLNGILISTATLRAVGMVLILAFVSPTLQAFFLWQIVINALTTALCGVCLWKSFPPSALAPRFDKHVLKRIQNFAIGIGGISILVTLYSQLDKIILSRMLSLELFGIYCFAFAIAGALSMLVAPIASTFFPRFSELVSMDRHEELKEAYHQSCQLMSIVIIPVAAMLLFFSSEIIFLWTRNLETTRNASLFARLLMIHTLINGLMTLPYMLQLAYGWTKLTVYKSLIALAVMTPLLVLGVYYYGALGAIFASILLNLGYFLIEIPMMHRRILIHEKSKWYLQDVLAPAVAVLFVASAGWKWIPLAGQGFFMTFVYLSLLFILLVCAAAVATPHGRRQLVKRFSRKEVKV